MPSKILRLTVAAVLLLPTTSALAAPAPQSQDNRGFFQKLVDVFAGQPEEVGQPSEECGEEDTMTRPGRSADARGSAFAEDGVAGQHYAGEQPQNSKNPKSVSQYDVACAKVSANTTQP